MSNGRPGDAASVWLPDAARQRVLGYASTALGALDPADVPPALRRFAAFTPAKRARLAGPALATVIEQLPGFRQAAATVARLAHPELGAAVEAGAVPPAADPVEVAALAFLVRPDGWEELVSDAAARLADVSASAEAEERAAEAERLKAEAAEARRAARAEHDRLRAEVTALARELGD